MKEDGERGPLGLLVVFLRLSRGLTQKELGKAARVDQGDVSRYEMGKQIPPEEAGPLFEDLLDASVGPLIAETSGSCGPAEFHKLLSRHNLHVAA